MNSLMDQLLKHHNFIRFTQDNPVYPDSAIQSLRLNNFTLNFPDAGILQLEPDKPGSKDIILSCAIHGNETAPIEICNLLIKEILESNLTVNNRVLFIIGNIPAMKKSIRFDVENMNRLFCGKHIGKTHSEARRAARIEQICGHFFNARQSAERCHFDLHTAIRGSKYEKFAIYPYQDGRQWNHDYLNLFKNCGINTIMLSHQPSATFSYYTSHEFLSNSFTVELGKVRPFGENNLPSFNRITNTLRSLIKDAYKHQGDFSNNGLNLFKVVDEVIRYSNSNFSLNIDTDIENFSNFPIGFKLTTDDNSGYQITSEEHAIVFPNANVPPGQRVALIVEKTTV